VINKARPILDHQSKGDWETKWIKHTKCKLYRT